MFFKGKAFYDKLCLSAELIADLPLHHGYFSFARFFTDAFTNVKAGQPDLITLLKQYHQALNTRQSILVPLTIRTQRS